MHFRQERQAGYRKKKSEITQKFIDKYESDNFHSCKRTPIIKLETKIDLSN